MVPLAPKMLAKSMVFVLHVFVHASIYIYIYIFLSMCMYAALWGLGLASYVQLVCSKLRNARRGKWKSRGGGDEAVVNAVLVGVRPGHGVWALLAGRLHVAAVDSVAWFQQAAEFLVVVLPEPLRHIPMFLQHSACILKLVDGSGMAFMKQPARSPTQGILNP